jgi:dTDP-4-amino-4,6-dideoxy-D-galactose acyltransferase
MNIKRLEWDSDFFGYEIGKGYLESLSDIDCEFLNHACANFKLVYIFTNNLIKCEALNLVDEKITFELENYKAQTVLLDEGFEIKSFQLYRNRPDKQKALKDLALEAGIYSRFKTDSNFTNNEYEKLYIEWIESSLSGSNAFEVLGVVDNIARILGFITLGRKGKDLGEIGLIAVSEKARGKGIGKALIKRSLNIFLDMEINTVQVVTQKRNLPAMALYNSVGFKIKESLNIYHFWNI